MQKKAWIYSISVTVIFLIAIFFALENDKISGLSSTNIKTIKLLSDAKKTNAGTTTQNTDRSLESISPESTLAESTSLYPENAKDELISLSLETVTSSDEQLALDAYTLLLHLSPQDALKILRNPGPSLSNEVSVNQMRLSTLMTIGDDNSLLQTNELKAFYNSDSRPLKKLSAKLLSERGDNSLIEQYSKLIEGDLHNEDPKIRRETLFEYTSLNKVNAISNIKNQLNDTDASVRLAAMRLLGNYGSNLDVSTIEPLRYDENSDVRSETELVIKELWHKNPTN